MCREGDAMTSFPESWELCYWIRKGRTGDGGSGRCHSAAPFIQLFTHPGEFRADYLCTFVATRMEKLECVSGSVCIPPDVALGLSLLECVASAVDPEFEA